MRVPLWAVFILTLSPSCVTAADDLTDLIAAAEAQAQEASQAASDLMDEAYEAARRHHQKAGNATSSGRAHGLGFYDNPKARAQAESPRPVQKNQQAQPILVPQSQEEITEINLPHKGEQGCGGSSKTSPKCPSSLLRCLEDRPSDASFQASAPPSKTASLPSSSRANLFIFVSSSVPMPALKSLWAQAHRVGGKVIFKGLIQDSFKETQAFMEEAEIIADIDPAKFETYKVDTVPTFVLAKDDTVDKLSGNVSLGAFLEQSSERGELQEEAKGLKALLSGDAP